MKQYTYAKKAYSSPGSLVYAGTKTNKTPMITLISYSSKDYKLKKIDQVSELEKVLPNISAHEGVLWLNVDGLSDAAIIGNVGDFFYLHPLTQEDILNPNPSQRPKFEEFDDGIFLILKYIDWDEEYLNLVTEQLSFVLKSGILLTFQESEKNVFEPILDRIKTSKGRIRSMDSSYLLYALLDSVVDKYFLTLENIGELIDELEFEISEKNKPRIVQTIHQVRQSMMYIRKSVWPLRDVISAILRSENKYIHKSTLLFFRDLSDNIHQVIDTVENYRELLSGLLDLYLTMIGNKTNEIMKVLTIIATIFIPLTFVVGIYGMNFTHMPEIDTLWGYPLIWGVLLLISAGLIVYFRIKKWI